MTDKTTNVLLGLIAAGLWANCAVLLFAPNKALADTEYYMSIVDDKLISIKSEIQRIANGVCKKSKLC